MAFEDLNEYFDDALKLPIGGKVYSVQSVSADRGAAVMAMVSGSLDGDLSDIFDGEEEQNIYRFALGDTYEELIADGVSWAKVQHVGQTAVAWIVGGVTAAERVWAAEGAPGSSGKAPMAPQDRKPKRR